MIPGKALRFASALAISLLLVFLPCSAAFRNQLQAEGLPQGSVPGHAAAPATRTPPSAADDGARKRNEILERETAVALKEKELKSLSENLSTRIQQLQQARKEIEASLVQKMKDDAEKYKKMLKVYKALRPEAAAALMDKLDENMAFELLNQMDTKTAVKLIPLMNQNRVLKWTRLSLKDN
ncbi:MAG: MotE family protein [Geobacteraceae bacterium]